MNPTTPAVSVIIPTYNRASLLGEALTSVIRQTRPAQEIIVVDDGSTDDTGEVIQRIVDEHKNAGLCLRFLRQPNLGKSVALNHGLAFARGDWIAYDDSDDLWLPNKLERQFEAISKFPGCGVCFTDSRFVNNPAMNFTAFSRAGRRYRDMVGMIDRPLDSVCQPPHGIYMQSLLVRRDVMDHIQGFDPRFRVSQDTDFIFRLAQRTRFCYVNEPLVHVDRRDIRTVGLTTEFKRHSLARIGEAETMFEKWLTLTPADAQPTRRHLLRLLRNIRAEAAAIHLRGGDYTVAHSYIRRALEARFSPIVFAKFLMLVVSPQAASRAAMVSYRLRINSHST